MPKQKVYKHSYRSDLTDAQWKLLEPLFTESIAEPARVHPVRDVLDAIFYVNRTGCQWDYLPSDLPPWRSAYIQFQTWQKSGIWDKVHDTLRDKLRTTASRNPQPTAAVIDAQSTKTTEKGGLQAMMLVRKSKDENGTFS